MKNKKEQMKKSKITNPLDISHNNSKIYNNPSKIHLSSGSLSQATPKETLKKRKRRMTTKSIMVPSSDTIISKSKTENKRESKKRQITEEN